jgi:hypothetical protein
MPRQQKQYNKYKFVFKNLFRCECTPQFHGDRCQVNLFNNELILFFLSLFGGLERVGHALLCLCLPFVVFEGCLDSNPETCRSKQALYQLRYLCMLNFFIQ